MPTQQTQNQQISEQESARQISNPQENSARAGAENLAAYRASGGTQPNMRHGLWPLIERGSLPPGREDLAEHVDAVLDAMVSDLGGDSELTGQRRALLASQRLCLLVLTLAGEYLAREGLLSKRGKPHPILSVVVSFANTLRLNAVALGLERRAKDANTLEAVLKEYEMKGNNAEETASA